MDERDALAGLVICVEDEAGVIEKFSAYELLEEWASPGFDPEDDFGRWLKSEALRELAKRNG